jgi:phosphoribosyl-ATP pyrophosphohydrolase/phosphoribosyl-AMP cyclohydrolase
MTDRTLSKPEHLDALEFDARGLLPVVVQDSKDGAVLMVAWANREALELTLSEGETHFWSRSRQEIWHKGGTSGNTQQVVSLHADCDGDTVLVRVKPSGPACHTHERTCFGASSPPDGSQDLDTSVLQDLWRVLRARAAERPEGSYTSRLLDDENLRIKKLGEETAELIHALGQGDEVRVAEEAADLLYHLMVGLLGSDVSLHRVLDTLRERRT